MPWSVAAAAVGAIGANAAANKNASAQKKAAEAQQAAQGQGAGAASQAAGQQSWADINQANDLNKENQDWAYQKNMDNAQKMQEMNQGNISWSNDLNRSNQLWGNEQNQANQLWGQGINQAALDKQLGQNRIDQTNAMGNSLTYDPVTGKQTSTLNTGDQATLDALRGKEGSMVGGLGGGFDVNGDVMNAYRARQQPLLDASRNKENARLAAMGLGTGSGSAWGTAQDALNRNQTDADASAIMQGFQADQSLRSSNRADLGAMENMRGGIQSGLTMPDYTKAGFAGVNAPSVNAPNAGTYTSNVTGFSGPTVAAPKNTTYEAWQNQQDLAQKQYDEQMKQQGVQNGYTGQILGMAGSALGNKDVQAGLGKAWDWATTPSSSGTDNQWGYTSGSAGASNTTGFDW